MAKDQHNQPDSADNGLAPPAGLRLVPTEQIVLLTVTLPQMPMAQRRAAVAFAVEDHIAQPLDDVHVVLGPQIGTDWLVAVVARRVAAGWPQGRLVADVGMLPVPAPDEWSVFVQGPRILVRCPDGTGFATHGASLGIFHLAAGHPALVLYGGTLPDGFTPLRRDVLPGMDAAFARFDLNLARNGGAGMRFPRRWRRLVALVAVAAVGHLMVAGLDTLALLRQRAAQVDAVRVAAGLPASASVEPVVAQALVTRQGQEQSPLLPRLSSIFSALQDMQVSVRDLRYIADAGSITLTLEAQDIVTLQASETALRNAGLTVASGAASSGDGLAEQQITITGGTP